MKYFVLLFNIFLLVSSYHIILVQSSIGDRLEVFKHFYSNCIQANCSHPRLLKQFNSKQPIHLQALGWNCKSECQLEAQWRTLDQLKALNISKVPQFYGKWTFYRLFGIQEPASFIFSLCNFATNFYGWRQYKQYGRRHKDPYYHIWALQALIASNAWLWSMVYHARETSITEKLDYYSAFLIVLYSFYAILVKLLSEMFFLENEKVGVSIALPFVAVYLYHWNRMNTRFDYGYNMKVNVITGSLSTLCWLIWCFVNRKKKHIYKCIFSLLFVNACLALELFDFPPLFYIFDAHSIWHLATSFFPIFWYSFLKEEAISMQNYKQIQNKKNQ